MSRYGRPVKIVAADQATGRPRVRVSGAVRRVRTSGPAGLPMLRAELGGGADRVTVIWLGRNRITGIEPGRLLAVAFVLLGPAGCGQRGGESGARTAAHTDSAKAQFIVAADRVCARHLDTILAWLERPQTREVWQQRATQNEGIYRIVAATITRLQGLGPPPGPDAE